MNVLFEQGVVSEGVVVLEEQGFAGARLEHEDLDASFLGTIAGSWRARLNS
jgi:hypothetical protein